jgi:DNA repair protein RecO (recombination protein O)
MKFKNYSTEAVVLSRKTYGEADRLITVFTQDQGKMTLLAKGVRRPKSRKRGSLEVFSRVKCSIVNTKSIPLLTEAEVINSFQEIKHDLTKVAVAYSFMETIIKTTREDEENKILYKTLIEYLDRLGKEDKLKDLRYQFIQDVLVLLGFWPLGEKIADPERALESVIEGRMATTRIGKKILEK